jgi:hypothetical protein
MFKPFYYSLADAADRIGVSKDLIAHMGAIGRLSIVIPTPPKPCFIIETIDYEKSERTTELKNIAWMELLYITRRHIEGDINYGMDGPNHSTLPVHGDSLKEFESGFLDQDLVLYRHGLKDGRYSELVKIRNPTTGEALKLRDAKLCVLTTDIERLMIDDDTIKTENKLESTLSLKGKVEEIGTKISNLDIPRKDSMALSYFRLIFDSYGDKPNAETFLKRLIADGFENDFQDPKFDREIAPIFKISTTKGIWLTYDEDCMPSDPHYTLGTIQKRCSDGWVSAQKKGKASNNNKK